MRHFLHGFLRELTILMVGHRGSGKSSTFSTTLGAGGPGECFQLAAAPGRHGRTCAGVGPQGPPGGQGMETT
ncbi:hypothetical protein NHX12_016942 [Muraenolepis orangiensis]|uniref:Uncharacterized protein n=1 Tax=Muraenolepis orangiensis TaxID=630683 RepID=A0A9Q0F0I6_9TELE|nr:hypothetical protein NHX12_032618 [Muraenolepis orangiensis]KAJ3615393.1 hypothetical protein NHX12_016942 [Muraenolepis orangiensis]